MSILSVTELYEDRSHALEFTTPPPRWNRSYTRSFEVETSDPAIGPIAVRTATGIPTLGSAYDNGLAVGNPLREFDNGAFVNAIGVEPYDAGGSTGTHWKVTVNYIPFPIFDLDPTLWKIRVRFGGERTERVIYFDKDGNPVGNSARDRFADPVTVPDHISTMEITRNELVTAFDPDLASQYSDTVNDATWNGFAAKRCLMGLITTSEVQYDPNAQVYFYQVTYPVSISRGTWVKEILDNGFNALNGSGLAVPIMRGGQPISEPVPLDGSGHELAPGGTPVTLTFDVFDEADWSGLNINLAARLGL